MRVTHQFEVRAICPVDGCEDVYEAEFTTPEVVAVEFILQEAAVYAAVPMYQEDMTRTLAKALARVGSLTTVGVHSGVRTTVTVET